MDRYVSDTGSSDLYCRRDPERPGKKAADITDAAIEEPLHVSVVVDTTKQYQKPDKLEYEAASRWRFYPNSRCVTDIEINQQRNIPYGGF